MYLCIRLHLGAEVDGRGAAARRGGRAAVALLKEWRVPEEFRVGLLESGAAVAEHVPEVEAGDEDEDDHDEADQKRHPPGERHHGEESHSERVNE